MEKMKLRINWKVLIPILIAIVVITSVRFIAYLFSKDYDYFLQIGEYEKAYQKAKTEDDKEIVITQNAIDYINRRSMKNAPILVDQVKIEKAWYNRENKNFILGYRDIDNNLLYFYFVYNKDMQDYTLSCSAVNNITANNIEIANKTIAENMKSSVKNHGFSNSIADYGIYVLKNGLVETMTEIMKEENSINEISINNVNHFIESKDFDNINLLDVNE